MVNRSDGVSDRSKRTLVIVATAAAFLLFFLMVLAGELSRRFEPHIDFAAIETGTTGEGYPYLGSPDAPVRIAKYADYLCYYCREFLIEVEPQIVEEYVATGEVRLESRYYASGNVQLYLTSAAHCAADQERYWEFDRALFMAQSRLGTLTTQAVWTEAMTEIAETAGLDIDEFLDCWSSNRYIDTIMQSIGAARDAGVRYTPTFLVNNTMFVGGAAFSEFQLAIENALAEVSDE